MHVLEKLYERKFYKQSVAVADRLFTLAESRYYLQALVVKADSLLELQSHSDAETLYRQVLAKTDTSERKLYNIDARIATAIYKQGEYSAANGTPEHAVQHFLRVKSVAPQSTVTPLAEFDAAVLLIKHEKYAEAVPILERFHRQYPGHRLQSKAAQNLALAYARTGNDSQAATQLEIVAQDNNINTTTRRDALWQAAQLQEQSGYIDKAQTLFAQYVLTYPAPVAEAIEVCFKLAQLYKKTGPSEQVKYWQQQLLSAASENVAANNERVRYLAATTALAVANEYIQAFNSVKLVAPLKETLPKKKNAMAQAVDSLTKVNNYAHQQTTTEATFKIAQLYAEFGKALMASEPPRELSGDELEQYKLLLEEQAIPFEEKAIEYHTLNIQLVKQGIYDQWVKNSFKVLAKLVPAKYNRAERPDEFIEIPLAHGSHHTTTVVAEDRI
jgi:TolA-binding protein